MNLVGCCNEAPGTSFQALRVGEALNGACSQAFTFISGNTQTLLSGVGAPVYFLHVSLIKEDCGEIFGYVCF